MIGQVEIAEMEKGKVKEIEEMRENMVTATNTAALTVMGLNNELAELEVNDFLYIFLKSNTLIDIHTFIFY